MFLLMSFWQLCAVNPYRIQILIIRFCIILKIKVGSILIFDFLFVDLQSIN
jgi:hypothetical protein